MNFTNDQIEKEVREHCAQHVLGDVHVGIAVDTAIRYCSAQRGKDVADKIAAKMTALRARFPQRVPA